MNKMLKRILLISFIMIGAFVAFVLIMNNNSKKLSKKHRESAKAEIDINMSGNENLCNTFGYGAKVVDLYVTGDNANVLLFDHSNPATIYDVASSESVKSQLARMQDKKDYIFESPLLAYNPYGTNNSSLYIYFETKKDCYLKYTVSVADKNVPDFVRTMTDSTGNGYKKHEYSITGLIPGMENYLYMELCAEDGGYIDSHIYRINMPQSVYGNAVNIPAEHGKNIEAITNGLYFCYGTGTSSIPVYDNSGYLRAEIPLLENNTVPIQVGNAYMTVPCSTHEIVRLTRTGQVVSEVYFPDYSISDDMTDNGMGQMLAIASDNSGKSVRDVVISVDMQAGTVSKVFDAKEIFRKTYKKSDKGDWIGFDSIEYASPSDVVLGATKRSAIVCIANIMTANPVLKYVIGNRGYWNEKDVSEEFLAKTSVDDEEEQKEQEEQNETEFDEIDSIFETDTGEPEPFGDLNGNVSVLYEPISEEQHYLHLLNNNAGQNTEYWKLLINTSDKTYMMQAQIPMPANANAGAISMSEFNAVEYAPDAMAFSEVGMDSQVIAKYSIVADSVDKYSMKDFWFK